MPGGIVVPLEQWVAWPAPNYVNPASQPRYILFFSCIFGPISIVMLFTRLWVRIRLQHDSRWDDWLMLIAFFPVIVLTVLLPFIMETYHMNRHVWDIPINLYPLYRQYCMAIYALFSCASGLIKMSVLLFYRRLSYRVVSVRFRWILRITIAAIGVYTIAFTLVPIFACTPISAFWEQVDYRRIYSSTGYEFKCINEGADVLANGIVSTVQDLIVAFLPTILCWNLKMPIRQKIALYSIFAVSYTTVAVGTIRTSVSYRIFYLTYDTTWAANDMWLLCLLELHIGCMCANAPTLKVFFARFLENGRLPARSRSGFMSRFLGIKSQHSADMHAATDPARSKSVRWKSILFWIDFNSRNDSENLSRPQKHASADTQGDIIRLSNCCDSVHERHNSTTELFPLDKVKTTIERSNYNGYDYDTKTNKFRSSWLGFSNDIQALPPIARPKPAKWAFGRWL